MQLLIVVRHGEYDRSSGSLTDNGRRQITGLAEKLKPFISEMKIGILSSRAKRAQESAQILVETLGVGSFEWAGALYSDPGIIRLPEALELVRANKNIYDVIILVTHFEFTEEFPEYFGREELKKDIRSAGLEKGEAWVMGMNGELRRVRTN